MKPKDNYFNLEKFKEQIIFIITKEYIKGGLKVSKDKSPSRPDSKELKQVGELTLDLIKGVTQELSAKIKREIRDSILKGEDNRKLAKRLDNIFNGDNPTRFRYEDRLKLIARTESTRAYNAGAHNTANELGFKKKYIAIVNDGRTSEVSKAMAKKYGSEENAINIEEEFFVNVGGKEYRGLYPPFMPNDRDMVLYT